MEAGGDVIICSINSLLLDVILHQCYSSVAGADFAIVDKMCTSMHSNSQMSKSDVAVTVSDKSL